MNDAPRRIHNLVWAEITISKELDYDSITGILHRAAQERGSRVLAVAAAQDAEVLLAVDAARKLGIATAILVGDEEQIRAIAQAHDIPLEPHRILPEPDKVQACRTAVKLVRDGQADAVMKGIVDTSIILKAVLDKEIGLRDARFCPTWPCFRFRATTACST